MELFDLRPGTVVRVRIGLTPFYHVGLISDTITDGAPNVISNSQRCGGVAEEPLADFGDPSSVLVLGYLSELSPAEVMYRARRYLGGKWHLVNWNCEQFVRVAHGLKAESPQLTFWVSLLGGVALVYGVIRLARRG